MADKIQSYIWEWDYLGIKPLLRELNKFASTLPNEYSLVDVGCGSKPYRKLFTGATKYIGLDIVAGPEVDIIGKAWELPFADNEFDILISTQVLEHTEYVHKAMQEMQRVVKPGGRIFISAPFAFQEHGMPYDYWRFTQSGLRSLFKDVDIDYIVPLQGFFKTQKRLLNAFLVNLWVRQLTEVLFIPLYLFNNIQAVLWDGIMRLVLLTKFNNIIGNNYWSLPENYVIVATNSPAKDVANDQLK